MFYLDISIKKGIFIYWRICTLVLIIVFGVSYNILISPIFITRYLIPSLGILWLCFSIALSKIDDKRILIPFLILTLLVAACAVNIDDYKFKDTHNHEKMNMIQQSEFHNGSIIICENEINYFEFSKFYIPDNIYFYYLDSQNITNDTNSLFNNETFIHWLIVVIKSILLILWMIMFKI